MPSLTPPTPPPSNPSLVVQAILDGKAEMMRMEEDTLLLVARGWSVVQDRIDQEVSKILFEISDPALTIDQRLAAIRELDRYKQLQTYVSKEALKYSDQVQKLIVSGQKGALNLAIESGKSVMDTIALTPLLKAQILGSFDIVPVRAVEDLLFSFRTGAPLEVLIHEAAGEMSKEVQSGLLEGLALGYSNSQIVKLITSKVAIPVDRMMNITATEMNRAYRFSTWQFYKQSSGIDGMIRLAAHNSRTCPACLFKDGEFIPMNEEPTDHPRGRCTFIPHFKAGNQIPHETGREWFLKQDDAFQRSYLGDQPYALWKSGQIQLSDLAGTRHNPTWGSSPKTISLTELKKTAKAPGTYQPDMPPPPPAPAPAGTNSVKFSGVPGHTKEGLIQNKKMASMFEQKAGINPNHMSLHEKGAIKNELVTAVSQRSGLPYDAVNDMIAQWARTSNDNSLSSLSIQRAIAKEMGVPLSDWQQKTFDRLMKERAAQIASGKSYISDDFLLWGERKSHRIADPFEMIPALSQAGFTSIDDAVSAGVKAIYEYTQETLKAQGISEVTLFRGVGFNSVSTELTAKLGLNFKMDQIYGVDIDITTNAASSYSLKKNIAERFGSGGVITQITVPVERIFSTAMTGQGCFSEWEVVVLGSDFDKIRIIK